MMSPIERRRGCGYRKIGKLYLVGSGLSRECDNLPYPIVECECCGWKPKFTRNFMWINKNYIKPHEDCSCDPRCPICHPESNDLTKYGLMWVGKRYYTPQSFIREALEMGVSKAIPLIPKGLVLGKTWVLLAHKECEFEDGKREGIFYAFIPQRIEMLVWEDTPEEKIKELEEKGITVIRVPRDAVEHDISYPL